MTVDLTTVPDGTLEVLVVDDEEPALEDLAYLLRQHPRIGSVVTASDATEALRRLRDGSFAAVFLDIRMPGLDGLELARVLSRFATPPDIVFVTAFEQHAVEAFELQAVDYLLKPVRPERLSDAIRRLGAGRPRPGRTGAADGGGPDPHRGGDRRRHPDGGARLHPVRGGQRRLRPPPHRRRRLPRPGADLLAGGVVARRRLRPGPPRVTSSPSATSPSCGPGPAAATTCWWPARSCRSAAATPGSSGTGWPAAPAPCPGGPPVSAVTIDPELAAQRVTVRNPGAGPPGRRRRANGPWPSWPSRPRSARSCSARSPGPSSCWRCGSSPCSASSSSACRRCSPASPGLADYRVFGLPLPWLVLGGAVYPLLVLLGVLYVRQAERNERDFVEFIERSW